MARSYRPVVRDQEFLLPPNMAEWLPQGHLVWFVIDVVERMDTGAFHRARRLGGVGRQGYDPDMLLALLVYAYAVGEKSSRRIERLCVDHVAFRVLCGQDPPDHSTLARFRADHDEAFADFFAQVLRLCSAAGMARVGVVAIDGTKIAADAARGANRTVEHVRAEARRIADEVLAEADAIDAAEDLQEQARDGDDSGGDDLPPGLADRRSRAASIERALAEVERQESVLHEIDVKQRTSAEAYLARIEAGESIIGRPPAGVDLIRYHQARLDRAMRELAAIDGVRGNGIGARRREARRVLELATVSLAEAEAAAAAGELDVRVRAQRERERRHDERGGPVVNVTDPDSRLMTQGSGGGSIQGYNAQLAVTDDHLILGAYVSQDANDLHCFEPALTHAMLGASTIGAEIGTVLADAGYFTEHNLTMPGPDRLIASGKSRSIAREAADHPADGPPPLDADAKDAMRHRLRKPDQAALYKRRSATVETVIAHLKETIRLRTFSRRGLPAVTAELQLAAATVNLLRLHATTSAPA